MTRVFRLSILTFALCCGSMPNFVLALSPTINTSQSLELHDEHEHEHEHEEHDKVENIIVQATRSGRIADEQAMRIELINREEITEKATMRPGNISMLVAETGGVRVQTTSPALGSANIRLQGLYGRYTQLLADGLPLYGNQAASIGLLQIPPTDLGRVEIIKGSASSLYGGSALGGVINLVSRQPKDERTGELLVNLTTRDGQDATTYLESPLTASLKGSITAGAHHQKAEDTNSDDWIDLPGYERYTVRPRLFWDNNDGKTLYLTTGYMTENRRGGNIDGGLVPSGNSFLQAQTSERSDAGLVFSTPISDLYTLSARASAMVQEHEHVFGEVLEYDKHEGYLAETTLSSYSEKSEWLVGLAFQSDRYSSQSYSDFDFTYSVPAVFGQIDFELLSYLSTSVSVRVDDHSEFGTQLSPRISGLYRHGDLSIRGSYGEGYYAPTPFVEEIEANGLSRLEAFQDLKEEQAHTLSLDFTYRFDNIESSLTLFASDIKNTTELEEFSLSNNNIVNRVRLINKSGTSKIKGSELLLRYYWKDLKLTASYLYLDTQEQKLDTTGKQEIALTPKHSAGFVAMWEQHGNFRAGFEAYYTGSQRLNNNPYIERSSPYWHLGLMGEITMGNKSWFINLENLLDIKQNDEHPLLLESQTASGQWTTDIWSRNDGFIVNAGLRLKF